MRVKAPTNQLQVEVGRWLVLRPTNQLQPQVGRDQFPGGACRSPARRRAWTRQPTNQLQLEVGWWLVLQQTNQLQPQDEGRLVSSCCAWTLVGQFANPLAAFVFMLFIIVIVRFCKNCVLICLRVRAGAGNIVEFVFMDTFYRRLQLASMLRTHSCWQQWCG
jgi:hypothetical protein